MPASSPSTKHLKQLGKNVVRLRNALELTQEQVAEKIGVSARYFQSVEAGRYFPSLKVLTDLRMTLKCTWDELFDGIGKS